jgi:hypothetical protein
MRWISSGIVSPASIEPSAAVAEPSNRPRTGAT